MRPFEFAWDIHHEMYSLLCWSFDCLNWPQNTVDRVPFLHIILTVSSTYYLHNSDANLFGIFHHKIGDQPSFLIICWYCTLLIIFQTFCVVCSPLNCPNCKEGVSLRCGLGIRTLSYCQAVFPTQVVRLLYQARAVFKARITCNAVFSHKIVSTTAQGSALFICTFTPCTPGTVGASACDKIVAFLL